MTDIRNMSNSDLARSLRTWADDIEDDRWKRAAALMRAAAERLEGYRNTRTQENN